MRSRATRWCTRGTALFTNAASSYRRPPRCAVNSFADHRRHAYLDPRTGERLQTPRPGGRIFASLINAVVEAVRQRHRRHENFLAIRL
jgi:hypothetical protein